MLLVERRHVDAVAAATTADDLHRSLQGAIELEHSTIPPYLTALFSIRPGHNRETAEIIASVVREEMLHLTIAANLLNALGGSPLLDDPAFIPDYPGPLPLGVRGGLIVGLERVSRRLVREVFMSIEEPEHPLDLPVGLPSGRQAAPSGPEVATIGEFYAAIKATISEMAASDPKLFSGDHARQVCDQRWFPAEQLFPIVDVATSNRAIDVIVEQGEGSMASPDDGDGEPAHYYRFGEIVAGRRIVRAPGRGWAYAGDPVGLNDAGVWPICPDAKAADFPADSRARVLCDDFNASYSRLLRSLHSVFNGHPARLDMAMSQMTELQLLGQRLVSTGLPDSDLHAAPTFEFTAE